MSIFWKVLIICGIATLASLGCRRVDADVSSDGKTFVQATDKGFVIKSTDDKNLHVVISDPPGRYPKWSNADNEIAYFDAKDRLNIYSQPKHRPRRLDWKGDGPIAWSPGDKKLAFVQMSGEHRYVVIVNPLNGVYLGQEAAGTDELSDLQWMPDGKRLAVTQKSTITVLGAEANALFPFESDELFSAVLDNSTVIALAVKKVEGENVAHDSLVLCDVDTGKQTTVSSDIYEGRIPSDVISDGFMLDRCISRDGKKVGVFTMVDRSEEHALRQMLKPKLSKAEQARLEKRLKLEASVLVYDLKDRWAAPQRFPAPGFVEPGTELAWSADGKTLVAITEKQAMVFHP